MAQQWRWEWFTAARRGEACQKKMMMMSTVEKWMSSERNYFIISSVKCERASLRVMTRCRVQKCFVLIFFQVDNARSLGFNFHMKWAFSSRFQQQTTLELPHMWTRVLVLNHSVLPRIAEFAIIFHGILDSLLSSENKEKEARRRCGRTFMMRERLSSMSFLQLILISRFIEVETS